VYFIGKLTNTTDMTDKEILTALENALEFWQGELSRATRLEVIQFRKGVVYGLQLAIENIKQD
jgi:hypothetical protein